jgi:hypothetical protein
MGKMEAQRRQESVGCEMGLAVGDWNGQFDMGETGNRGQMGLERRPERTSAGEVEKNAPLPLAFVPAVVLVIATARRAALVAAVARMGVLGLDGARRTAFLRTGMGMMPAAAEH